jgi:hypothetical protein
LGWRHRSNFYGNAFITRNRADHSSTITYLVSIESYGGNPDIVATREEIARVAFEIKMCSEALSYWGPIEAMLSDPLRQIQFRMLTTSIHQKLERLSNHCLIASENYFTTEAQIHRRFETTLISDLAKVATSVGSSLGWTLDSKVSAELASVSIARKPSSITAMLDRLWKLSSNREPTIGIDLFDNPTGNKTAVVYIPGTQTFGFGEGDNPLDMASNIQAISSPGQAASERAVLLAMRQAGIEADDEVILVGHSQGGMVAGNLAAFPNGYIAAGLVAFGAPLAHIKNLKTPVMAIEHVNDPVPNLSGKANPLKRNWVTVQRISEKPESNALMFSHSLKSYKNTTTAIDVSNDVGIKNIKGEILEKLQGTKPSKSYSFVISREVP